eukprot:CAMPEP_0184335496 /NCGR_PEP_ID=MMETSP1089-20130417/4055_1 /TAXON_ID=38269 ORGANISM="Gloeochaete wittrockiana, Strain SAG46.84" /NCGR_SAMPLE_ID=MMETSP1089 /ASSEMBLY_ACC=CAM_ASM_000445 /LENGTH=573 /DNA_ID=CAMNT_0026660185 /DNA_START=30 /DNA_END=1751 /DNA_ORIENTATION=+
MPCIALAGFVFDSLFPGTPQYALSDIFPFLRRLRDKCGSSHRLLLGSWLQYIRDNSDHLHFSEANGRLLYEVFQCLAAPDGPLDPSLWPFAPSGLVDVRQFCIFLLVHFASLRKNPLTTLSPSSRAKFGAGDVWPSTSALEIHVDPPNSHTCLSPVAKSGKWPLQKHQKALSLLKEHLEDIIRFLATDVRSSPSQTKLSINPVSSASTEVTADDFDALSFLFVPCAPTHLASGWIPRLSRLTPFWEKDASRRVSVSEACDWVLRNLSQVELPTFPLINCTAKPSSPDSSPIAAPSGSWVASLSGVHKSTVVKTENDLRGFAELRIYGCQDTYLYVLSASCFVTILGCTDCTIVLGPVSRILSVEHCERLRLIAPSRQLRVSSCLDCTFNVCTPTSPLFFGDNRSLFLAPYNTFYGTLGNQLLRAGIDPQVATMFGTPLLADWPHVYAPCGVPTSSPLSQTVEELSQEASGISIVPPATFVEFIVPFKNDDPGPGPLPVTRSNPCPLRPEYSEAVASRAAAVRAVRQAVREASLDHGQQAQLRAVILEHFREWLMASGNARQVVDLQRLEVSNS